MSGRYRLYGWHLSYFTGKVRCYLRYKGIPFDDVPVDLYTLSVRVRRKTGAVVMPVLVTPEGEWLQDSSVILDHLEARFPQRPIHPADPVQRFASYLMEAWGDEWWVPVAMHTRWSYPENYALFEREAGQHLLPGFPRFLQRRAVAYVANSLRAKLHAVGVRPAQFAVLNAWTVQMLDWLDAHFAQHPYLLGPAPTLGDFGLVGTMAAHLGRDPWPARELIAPRRHLRAWIDRMDAEPARPAAQAPGGLPAGPVPSSLAPVYRTIFDEFTQLLQGGLHELAAARPQLPPGKAFARGLGDVRIATPFGSFSRTALPYTLWMAQRTLDVWHAMPPAEQQAVRAWAQPLGGDAFLALDIPRLERRALRVAPAEPSSPA